MPKKIKNLRTRKGYRKNRRKVLESNFPICGICGRVCSGKDISIDHIIPISKGGGNDIDNLQICCKKCNVLKGNNITLNKDKFLREKKIADNIKEQIAVVLDIVSATKAYPYIAIRQLQEQKFGDIMSKNKKARARKKVRRMLYKLNTTLPITVFGGI